jgi:hypothetical protein
MGVTQPQLGRMGGKAGRVGGQGGAMAPDFLGPEDIPVEIRGRIDILHDEGDPQLADPQPIPDRHLRLLWPTNPRGRRQGSGQRMFG